MSPSRASLKIFALNTLIAAVTKRMIEDVVVMSAVWIVVQEVELCCVERGFAGVADEAWGRCVRKDVAQTGKY